MQASTPLVRSPTPAKKLLNGRLKLVELKWFDSIFIFIFIYSTKTREFLPPPPAKPVEGGLVFVFLWGSPFLSAYEWLGMALFRYFTVETVTLRTATYSTVKLNRPHHRSGQFAKM